jgi:hypothetical protein
MVIAQASVSVVTLLFQSDVTLSYGTGRYGGSGGGADADLDVEEAAEAENATMMTNQTAANGNLAGGTNSTS